MKAVKIILCVVFAACLFIAYANKRKDSMADVPVVDAAERKSTDAINAHLVYSTVSQLHTGDVVLRMGTGADSYMLMQMSRRDKRYSHCGIVMVENGYPFVYHSIGGETNPDERMRRDSAHFFFSPVHNTAIAIVRYAMDARQLDEFKETVAARYASRPKFDMQFDLSTDDKLYCSEFVYKTFCKVLRDTAFIHITPGSIRHYIGIDELYLNPRAEIVSQIKFKQYLCRLK